MYQNNFEPNTDALERYGRFGLVCNGGGIRKSVKQALKRWLYDVKSQFTMHFVFSAVNMDDSNDAPQKYSLYLLSIFLASEAMGLEITLFWKEK